MIAFLIPLLAAGAAVVIANAQFDNWTGGTSQSFTTSNGGSTWSPTAPAAGIPDNWSANNGSYYGVTTQTVARLAYTIGSGSDATTHGSYVCQCQAGTSIQQSIAIPAGAAGRSITVTAWIKQPSTRSAVAQLALGASSQVASLTSGDWQLVTLNISSSHSLAGTNATLKITAHTYAGATNYTEVASVAITVN